MLKAVIAPNILPIGCIKVIRGIATRNSDGVSLTGDPPTLDSVWLTALAAGL